ncbi:MAG: hypothetical protein AAGK66_08980 [Pseudomonadota bacterium]
MRKPSFDMTLSLGHMLQVVALALAVGGSWVAQSTRITVLEGDLGHAREAFDQLQQRVAEDRSLIRRMENDAARMDERLAAMGAALQRIEALLERIDERRE